ncbi:MAG TPA: twin-arginine translocase TatA/TatE family subunit [Naasia sp.]|jgi:sec-independent protein translocase protein TatA
MFGNAFSGWHLIAILAIVLLLFGAPKLPALAKSVGQSMNILKREIKTDPADADGQQDGTTVAVAVESPGSTPAAGVAPARMTPKG